VQEVDRQLPDEQLVARVVERQLVGREAGHLLHVRALDPLDVNRNVVALEQLPDPHDRVAHHRPPDVVRVVVAHEHTGHAHLVLLGAGEELVDRVRRIDDDALAGLAVADEVGEVDHLSRHRVGRGEVLPRQQLAKVEALGHEAERMRRGADRTDVSALPALATAR